MPNKRRVNQVPDGPEDYGLAEVAALLGLSRAWAYKQRRRWDQYDGQRGGLRTFKNDDGMLRVRAEDFEAMRDYLAELAASKPMDLLTRQALDREARRQGGLVHALKHTPEEMAAPLREGRRQALEREADPDGTLQQTNPQEFARRLAVAENLRISRMNMARLRQQALREEYGGSHA